MLLTTASSWAQKSIYIPNEWRQNRTDTLLYAESDPDNKYTWSKSRSRETDNVIVFWDKYYGNTIPTNAPYAYQVDIDDLLRKAEAFFDLELNTLGFVDPQNSNLSRYKVMILMNHTTGWVCYGGGYDYQVSALWLSPSTCKPVGHSVAHEIGHSFHYMCYSESSAHGTKGGIQTGFHGAVGNGSVTWEQTAQWQANQSYPELMFDQSIGVFRHSHNYAFTHEWHRYQSYWFFYYLCQHYGDIRTVANVWNYPETSVKDFNEVLMDLKGLSVGDLFRLYFDYACRAATWDFDACAPYRNPYVGDFDYRCALTDEGRYQVALASCPQSTGFNVIPLAVPQAGTEVTTHFTAMRLGAALAASDPSQYLNGETQFVASGLKRYNAVGTASSRGFRLGYAALMKDGTRRYFAADSVYCTGASEKTEDVTMTVPEGVDRLWLIVSPAPSKYIQHRWDESISGDDMWPYQFDIEGTDLTSKAVVYANPTLDGRTIGDITLTYDVTFPADAAAYSGTQVSVGGQAAAKLGTAFQLQTYEIADKMQAYSASGPGQGKIMFYAVNADSTLAASGSTANGYGHWFNAAGQVGPYGNGYIFSEFDPATLTFSIGQYPGKCTKGSQYTVRQALRYRKSSIRQAIARFIFNITIGDTAGSTLNHIDYDDEFYTGIRQANAADSQSAPAVYDLTGRKVDAAAMKHGVYIVNGKKYIKK